MTTKQPDRIPIAEWRRTAETVGEMRRRGWSILARCDSCLLVLEVNLSHIIAAKGPEVSLWNRKSRCRRLGCPGFVSFQGRPPGASMHSTLTAPWPEGVEPRPARRGSNADGR